MSWSVWMRYILFAEKFETKQIFSVLGHLLSSWFIFRKNYGNTCYVTY